MNSNHDFQTIKGTEVYLYRVLQKERKKVEAFFVMKLQSNYLFDHKLLFVIFIHLL